MKRTTFKTWQLIAGILLLVMSFPHPAEAHLVTTGLGPVYDGIGHLVTSVEDVIPVLGVALLAGLRGSRSGRWTLLVLPLAWFVGGVFGLHAHEEVITQFQWASFLAIGILVATNLPIPAIGIAAIALAVGLFHGYSNGSAIKDAGVGAGVLELLGIMSSLFVIVSIFAALVIWLRWDWSKIVVRVAGSWIAAMGLLLLGWAIHKGA